MKYRRLGRNGPQVSAISMGRGSQPIKFGDPSEQEFSATIRRAYELGINFFGYVAYAPLGRGLLTGRIKSVDDLLPTDRRRRHPRFHPENLARNVKLVEGLEAAAREKDVTSAQLALAWIIAQGDDIVPIPGTNHVRNVEQNAAAADIELTTEDLRRLDEIFAIGAGAGARYHDVVLQGIGL